MNGILHAFYVNLQYSGYSFCTDGTIRAQMVQMVRYEYRWYYRYGMSTDGTIGTV